ncbi:acetylxylan esterase [Arcticibacterium luteifluviistationis]|uniref:Acetylxylan esterase n=2 Tax=Arcticibacterium luteifluviistationis TaxID=1784714 RepID=A0A2Z4GIH0_9BACT|nr:acetylxylan esterase [Arcticibacterium luteifluviistationis]
MAQQATNYDEAKVPVYKLPAILEDGKTVNDWESKRRAETLSLFESEVYGKTDLEGVKTSFKVAKQDNEALDGKAIRKEIVCTMERNGKQHSFSIMLFTPKAVSKAPVFLGLNFYGNHTLSTDSGISISENWVPNKEAFFIENNKATETSRGVRAYRWPIEKIIDRGYGLANIYCGDLDPDFDDSFKNGLHSILGETSMATIGAWAVGFSKAMDYLETDNDVDAKNVAVFGHSRLGKAALWASAQDPRFKMTISNESGCGGAALSKREYGERLEVINTRFPHWFATKFKKYNSNEAALPIDQHQLLALIAPRALYVGTAEDDQWSDPRGQYLSLYEASKLYESYGFKRIPEDSPKVNETRQIGPLGYHERSGKHEVMPVDWANYLDFADKHLK